MSTKIPRTKQLGQDAGDPAARAGMVRLQFFDQRGKVALTEWKPPEEILTVNEARSRPMPPTAMITGVGHGGIGHATALELVKRGWRVVACDRDREAGERTCEALQELGGDVAFVAANVARESGVRALMAKVEDVSGRIDLLVNNAGWAGDPDKDNIFELGADQARALVEHNLLSAFLVTQAAVRRFMYPASSGSVVFLGTHNGQLGRGILGQSVYGAAKCGLTGLMATFVAQVGTAIRFFLVRPGITVTNSKNWQQRRVKDPAWERREGTINPQGRLARPSEAAEVIAWLAEAPMHVNGIELSVDGGLTAAGLSHPSWNARAFRKSFVDSVVAYEISASQQGKAA